MNIRADAESWRGGTTLERDKARLAGVPGNGSLTSLKKAAAPIMLELSELSIGFANKPLLRRLSLSVAPGEIVALHGPSGCGKTTLLRSICGLIGAIDGEVLLRGATGEETGWPVFRRRMPLMEQQPALLDGTVQANLARPFRYRSADGSAFNRDKAAALLEKVGLPALVLDQDARELSAGQQQRVALVRALLLEPAVLLLDEPTSALDVTAAERVQRLVSSLAQNAGLAALIVTHQRDQAGTWTHRDTALEEYQVTGA